MPRPKKKIESELLGPEDEIPEKAKPVTRLVDAEHTIKYREPVPVPIQEESDEESSLIWDDDDEEKKPRKIHKSVREKIQDKLGKAKVTGGDQVYLRIDRMPNYDSGSATLDGMGGDKEFCWRGPCTVDYITNDDYLADTAKRHGAGVYWFTLRHGKIIVASWMHKIGGSPQVATSTVDTMTGQPQVVYQSLPQTNGQTFPQPVPVTKTLKEVADIIEVVDRIRGNPQPQQQIIQPTEQPLSPKVALLSAMAENPEIVEAVTDKLMGNARGDHKPSITELLIKHGAELFKAAGGMFSDVIRTAATEVKQIKQIDLAAIRAQGEHNVSTQMADKTQPQNQVWNGQNQTMAQNAQRNESAQFSNVPQTASVNEGSEQTITDPKDGLILIALNGCEQNTPVKVVANQLWQYADRINEEAPHLSVDGWIEMFVEQTPEQTIELLRSGLLGEKGQEIAELRHSVQWVGGLRDILQSQEGDE